MSLVGHHIGRYRILEEIGSGGMSVVYKGLDTALDREVAVKVLHPHLAGKEDSRKRLAIEAKAVAKLQHPNILEVFDFVADDSQHAYIVTEYIRGQTLRQYAEKHAFDPPEIAAMAIHEVAAALAHAHEAGIIHRDLKPENVMVRDDGAIKLMDFGIAKILDREDRMTMTGALVGSPAHMAPEIIEGQEIGPEADVFSLGTMLYYFSTGHLPFSGPNATATLKKILDGSYEDPRKRAPAVSDGLAEIIAASLARQPSARYPNARRFQEVVFEYLGAVGFPRPGEELAWFFLDPSAYRVQMVARLVENRLQMAQQLVDQKQQVKALSCLNQVLALDAANPQARQLLDEMKRTRRRRSATRRGIAVAASSTAIVALCGALLWRDRGHSRNLQDSPPPAAIPQTASVPAEPRPSPPVDSSALTSGDPGLTGKSPNGVAPPTTTPGERSALERAKPVHPPKKAVDNVKLTLLFRPYGYAQIDGGKRQEQNRRHEFQLAPGTHHLVYGCSFCEEESTTIEVSATGETIRLQVQPKPSSLLFRYEPRDAVISLGGKSKTATESEHSPFEISFPKGEPRPQRVEYQVTRPGFKTKADVVNVSPGESKLFEGRLEPE